MLRSDGRRVPSISTGVTVVSVDAAYVLDHRRSADRALRQDHKVVLPVFGAEAGSCEGACDGRLDRGGWRWRRGISHSPRC
jgi:hypothetical protein